MPVLMPVQRTAGLRGAGSASAIESPGSILKRASNRIRVALENQDSGKTGEQQHRVPAAVLPHNCLTFPLIRLGQEFWWCNSRDWQFLGRQ